MSIRRRKKTIGEFDDVCYRQQVPVIKVCRSDTEDSSQNLATPICPLRINSAYIAVKQPVMVVLIDRDEIPDVLLLSYPMTSLSKLTNTLLVLNNKMSAVL